MQRNAESPAIREPGLDFTVQALCPETWRDFAALVERHNGVWGGCWCLEFHVDGKERDGTRREKKEHHVRAGSAHAALVYSGAICVGWCQFGSSTELPRIKHLRVYSEEVLVPPDWRITCLFVDKQFRGKGVAKAALEGTLLQIAKLGGGVVESYPEDVVGRKVSASFLHNGRLEMFEDMGFDRVRPLGKNHWVMSMSVSSVVP